MRPQEGLQLGRLVKTLEGEGSTLEELAGNLADAIVRAAGDRDVVLVGPFGEVAELDAGDFGLYLALAHPSAAPLLYIARCKPTASEVTKFEKQRVRQALVTACSRRFRRVQICNSLRALCDAAGVREPSPMLH